MPVHQSYGRKLETRPIRLMIVDDSIVARSVFQTILSPLPDFEIVATASSAAQALARLDATTVDIVLLDLAMPGMDGFAALPEILKRGRGARVLIVSASAGVGAEACVRAMTLGAADTLEKPVAGGFADHFRLDLVDKLRRIGGDSRVPDRAVVREVAPAARPELDLPAMRQPVPGVIDCLAIGASTGGLHALSALFAALPPSCDMPILVTQHLPASFMPYFADQMSTITGRPATVAREGMSLLPGQLLIAPGDAHITVGMIGGCPRILLNRDPAPSACMPSVDPMLASVAQVYAERAFAVVLSGMGRDGMIGARALVEAGGEVAVQNRATSVVWGMPGSVAKAGLAATIASPAQIAARIVERVEGRAARLAPWR
ncbi:chemotaxis-specific protein-glutamate methyltransferase CheB [uncultured Sphingomonas sp.]|uniref:chemotaxis-specific protein-glutamate methyltransferase CheB n=1 Tax=uncultured Sphingomonas sp. TaxID=158754 RepID=UPI002636AD93|nr:chemotaxis-specific protein-glutamate methyltransferase CheB [uncultured Sphingomonas sp.]